MVTPEELQYVKSLQQENDQLKARNVQQNLANATSTVFGDAQNQNLIEWQLELREILTELDRSLRGQVLRLDKEGNMVYHDPDDPESSIFNDYGVNEILKILKLVLNRNTILSHFEEKKIDLRVYDFGVTLADLIMLKYRDMMLTLDIKKEIEDLTGKKVELLSDGRYVHKQSYENEKIVVEEISKDILRYIEDLTEVHLKSKIKHYEMIHLQIVNQVEASYLRALDGGERESLRTARTVTQNEPLSQQQDFSRIMPKKKSLLNPLTWGR